MEETFKVFVTCFPADKHTGRFRAGIQFQAGRSGPHNLTKKQVEALEADQFIQNGKKRPVFSVEYVEGRHSSVEASSDLVREESHQDEDLSPQQKNQLLSELESTFRGFLSSLDGLSQQADTLSKDRRTEAKLILEKLDDLSRRIEGIEKELKKISKSAAKEATTTQG